MLIFCPVVIFKVYNGRERMILVRTIATDRTNGYLQQHSVEQMQKKESKNSRIIINSSLKYQIIQGFGGAFTQAAALQFQRLPKAIQTRVLELYFGQNGTRYTFGRVHMNSCDFCEKSYNFDNITNDIELHAFDMNVSHDTVAMIPFIQQALEYQPQMKLFASPWSPPGWMKTPIPQHPFADMVHTALSNGLAPEYQYSWALYFSKFLQAYQRHNINFWGVTVQNEPGFDAPWEACRYNASYMAEFVSNHLGPRLKKDFPQLHIMIYDHNKLSLFDFAKEIYDNPKAAQYVSGAAFHWYSERGSTDLDGTEGFDKVSQTYRYRPDKFLLATESCNCPNVSSTVDQAWYRAHRYARDILNDLNHFAIGWVDWNLILNHKGGPNHLGNLCDAPILPNSNGSDIIVQPMYYFLAHISKYVVPGSQRIDFDMKVRFNQPGKAQVINSIRAKAFSCDQSAQQHWTFASDSRLHVAETDFCLTNVDGQHVEVWKCWDTNTQRWTRQGNHLININDGKCLAFGDDQLHVETCDTTSKIQNWGFENQLIQSPNGQCVTPGYPLITASAFVTPSGQKVLIVANQNTVALDFELQVEEYSLPRQVPADGISTFLF